MSNSNEEKTACHSSSNTWSFAQRILRPVISLAIMVATDLFLGWIGRLLHTISSIVIGVTIGLFTWWQVDVVSGVIAGIIGATATWVLLLFAPLAIDCGFDIRNLWQNRSKRPST